MASAKLILMGLAGAGLAALPASIAAAPSVAAIQADNAYHGGQLDVPLNKSQVMTVDRPFTKAMVGNSAIADVLPISDRSLYVLGKTFGTTSLTLYDARNRMIAVVDVAVGPDVVGLKRQLAELMPHEKIGARMSNNAIVLTGVVSSAPVIDRAVQVAKTYAGDNIVNMMSVGSSQQVMLEVRFSEMSRTAAKQLGLNHSFSTPSGKFSGTIGDPAAASAFGTVTLVSPDFLGLNVTSTLDALERKGYVKTLAEPTLVALSGQTASFLAGGEFPVPVAQGTSGTSTGNSITVEFKPFGVSLAFTPTVLDDGVINLLVRPEVSSIDPSASVTINGLSVPGLQTRRADTTVELRDGQSFALAGLLRKDFQDTVRQFPILGSIPIIGALFRSSGFQKSETELVIIVTPRLVQPMEAANVRLPTDRAAPPSEFELFGLGRTDNAVGIDPTNPNAPAPPRRTPPPPLAPPPLSQTLQQPSAAAPANTEGNGYEL